MGNSIFITKSVFLFLILIFYGAMFTFIGLAFGSSEGYIESGTVAEGGTTFFSFIGNIIVGLKNVPLWINALLFTPLIITLTFMIITSLPTFNGGS